LRPFSHRALLPGTVYFTLLCLFYPLLPPSFTPRLRPFLCPLWMVVSYPTFFLFQAFFVPLSSPMLRIFPLSMAGFDPSLHPLVFFFSMMKLSVGPDPARCPLCPTHNAQASSLSHFSDRSVSSFFHFHFGRVFYSPHPSYEFFCFGTVVSALPMSFLPQATPLFFFLPPFWFYQNLTFCHFVHRSFHFPVLLIHNSNPFFCPLVELRAHAFFPLVVMGTRRPFFFFSTSPPFPSLLRSPFLFPIIFDLSLVQRILAFFTPKFKFATHVTCSRQPLSILDFYLIFAP